MYAEIKSFTDGKAVQLIAVSKMRSNDEVMTLYHQGQRHFAENRVQDLMEKYQALPKDIQWHLIGHLQKNKVKYVAPFVYMIHSVDDVELLQKIDHYAQMNQRVIKVLLQIHIADEEAKFGFTETEVKALVADQTLSLLGNVEICGVMGMATNTDNMSKIKEEFHGLKSLFDHIKDSVTLPNVHFSDISMGMSGDYKIAIEEGATMVRIGTALFS